MTPRNIVCGVLLHKLVMLYRKNRFALRVCRANLFCKYTICKCLNGRITSIKAAYLYYFSQSIAVFRISARLSIPSLPLLCTIRWKYKYFPVCFGTSFFSVYLYMIFLVYTLLHKTKGKAMRVLILSCNTGEGHNSCAKALKEVFESKGHHCIINAVVTILALFRWSQRIEAASALWEFIDMRFPDERMESIFANMVFNWNYPPWAA